MGRWLDFFSLLFQAWISRRPKRVRGGNIGAGIQSELDAAKENGPNIIIPDPKFTDDWGPASSIVRAQEAAGFKIFDKDFKDKNLNIVFIRNTNPEFDRFNCRMVHYWKFEGEVFMEDWPITTYPGRRFMIDRLLNSEGAAILAKGQYRGAYALDLHRSDYEALCQRKGKVWVHRDGNRDEVYDMLPRMLRKGMYGINQHATENPDDGISTSVKKVVGSASAGCLVNARVMDFVEARRNYRASEALWGNSFSPSLILDTDLDDRGTVKMEKIAPQIDEPNQSWAPTGKTTGIRNRNLLNVKRGRNPWKYTLGTDSRRHEIFPSYAKGLRAGIKLLQIYWTAHGLKTVPAILSRWAPDTDTIGSIPGAPKNSPVKYSRFVAGEMGIPVGQGLQTFHSDGEVRNADQLFRLVHAIAQYENYAGFDLPRHVFDEALNLLD